jgi:hypothetical protein
VDLTRDKEGLEKARALHRLVSDVLTELESADLPDHIELDPGDEVENPFS